MQGKRKLPSLEGDLASNAGLISKAFGKIKSIDMDKRAPA